MRSQTNFKEKGAVYENNKNKKINECKRIFALNARTFVYNYDNWCHVPYVLHLLSTVCLSNCSIFQL